MIATVGYIMLVLGVVCSAFAALLSLLGILKKGSSYFTETRVLSAIGTAAICIAFILVEVLLVNSRFDYEVVYDTTSLQMNLLQKLTAVWSNKSGSLLFWSLLFSLCVFFTAFGKWKGKKESYFPGVMLILHLCNLFFAAIVVFQVDPFARLWQMVDGSVAAAVFAPQGAASYVPLNGEGLNPLLKHLGMVIHPPLLYLGFIFFFIPFAFALVSLWRKDYSSTWIESTRTWLVLAWVFLTAGILLGCWWAYEILGWGGYWGWDPVEIAGLMPWLSGLGLLHCLRTYRSSARVRRWAYTLMVATVLLIIFGIYLSRTGAVSSVHAYSQSSIGPAFMGFFIFLLLLSIGTLVIRWKELRPKTGSPAYLSPEGLTCTLALCVTLLVLICLIGVTLPLTTRAFVGQSVEPSQLYYEWSFSPLLIVIFISMALGYLPAKKNLRTVSILSGLVLAVLTSVLFKKVTFFGLIGLWLVFFTISALIVTAVYRFRQSNPKKNLKRKSTMWAGILLHLGFAFLALGVVGSRSFSDAATVSLLTGQSTALGSWQITKTAAGVEVTADEQVLYAEEYVFQKDGGREVTLQPHILWYSDTGSTVSAPAIRSNLASDTYTAILEWDGFSNGTTTVLLSHYPLMAWMWIGGVLLMLGTLWLHFSTPFLKEDEEQ